MPRPFHTEAVDGFLHEAKGDAALGLTHGAGANCEAPLLVAVADAFAAAGITVLRFDLAFRRKRRFGPPHPSAATADRESVRDAAQALRSLVGGPIYLGGHSYGGRQAAMLAAENSGAENSGAGNSGAENSGDDPAVASGLLLLSYPLHPPNKPDQLRTAHFPSLRTPAVFVHGSNDPFGSPDELRTAMELIPAPTRLILIEGAGHDLRRGRFDPEPIIAAITSMGQ